ncbi:MAG TPA: hypothetical protein VKC53_01490 [Patescibacteria group bacterium]|nr:hypothetical protein [Patescibacteria group bacterium]
MNKKISNFYLKSLNYIVVVFIFLALVKGNFIGPLLQLNLSDFTRSPLPPYRDAIARSIGEAAIYFSIIEGKTPYNAKINATDDFVSLSKAWYAPYFLLGRKLVVNCSNCEYSITDSPSILEATDSSTLYPFIILKK